MAGPIKIQRLARGQYRVLKHGCQVADIRRSTADELGHCTEMPWVLLHATGRIDRQATYADAVDEAHKI
ncbi:hypothetical protein [Halomonas sp. LBP4]|uniref:hypothetical protein n=1 Tax=Halomonas sp. LBP4 TaxID=2044917 RepID=UPI000D770E2B|nr:hypothetical protein [Halomonas sp. LBP4]PXX94685.1 hypothetical protein CR157_21515 [Halomonas sp. LBP4]